MNAISRYAVREARLSAVRGELPSLIGTMLEIVEDTLGATDATTLDELPALVKDLAAEAALERETLEAKIADLEADLTAERDRCDGYRSTISDLGRTADEYRARAERAEDALLRADTHHAETLQALHSLQVTRRGNILHIALPPALRVPSTFGGPAQPWNTLSVPVITEREPAKGSRKRDACECCTTSATKHAEERATTYLSWTPPI